MIVLLGTPRVQGPRLEALRSSLGLSNNQGLTIRTQPNRALAWRPSGAAWACQTTRTSLHEHNLTGPSGAAWACETIRASLYEHNLTRPWPEGPRSSLGLSNNQGLINRALAWRPQGADRACQTTRASLYEHNLTGPWPEGPRSSMGLSNNQGLTI